MSSPVPVAAPGTTLQPHVDSVATVLPEVVQVSDDVVSMMASVAQLMQRSSAAPEGPRHELEITAKQLAPLYVVVPA
jgi:hypothetical protein